MKLTQRLALIVFALFVGLILLAGGAKHNQDLTRYRETIQQLVLEKTGRELQIRGALHATFLPWPGIELHDVWLLDPANLNAEALVQIEVVSLRVKLLPLLSGSVDTKAVALQAATLNFHRDADGRSNWSDLMTRTSVVEADSEDGVRQEIEAGAPLVAALSAGKISLRDSTVNWWDEQSDQRLILSHIDLNTSAPTLDVPFDVAMAFDARHGNDGNAATSSVLAKGRLSVELLENRYTLTVTELKTVTAAADRPTAYLNATASGELVIDVPEQTLAFRELSCKIADVPLEGELFFTRIFDHPAGYGSIQANGIDAANLLVDLGYRLPVGFDGDLLRGVQLQTKLLYTDDELVFSEASLQAGEIRLFGDLHLANLSKSAVATGSVRSNHFNAQPWLSGLGFELPPQSEMFSQVQLQTGLRRSGQLFSLQKLSLQVDDLLTEGNIEITDTNAGVVPVKFALQASEINLDHYSDLRLFVGLDSSAVGDRSRSDSPAQNLSEWLTALPDYLQSVDIEGEFQAQKLTVAGLEFDNLHLPLIANPTTLESKEARAGIYSGTLFSSLSLDISTETPRASATININGFEAQPLVSTYLGRSSPISGTGNVSVNLHGRGHSLPEWLQQAAGALSLKLSNGQMAVDLKREMRNAMDDVGRPKPQNFASDSSAQVAAVSDQAANRQQNPTKFTELNLTGVFDSGMIRSEDLSFETELVKFSGSASVDLLNTKLNSALTAAIIGSDKVADADLLVLSGLRLPMQLKSVASGFNDDLLTLGLQEFRHQLRAGMAPLKPQIQAQYEKSRQQQTLDDQSELQQSLERRRKQAEAAILHEIPSVAPQQRDSASQGSSDEFERQFEYEKAQLGDALGESIRRELSNLLDD